jgi:hypothetical protein
MSEKKSDKPTQRPSKEETSTSSIIATENIKSRELCNESIKPQPIIRASDTVKPPPRKE